MKKFSALLCVILVAISLSACRTFHDDTTTDYPQDNPLKMVVYLSIKNLPTLSTIDAELANWRSEVLTLNAGITDDAAPKITAIAFGENTAEGTYVAQLTVANVPNSTLRKQTQPFKIIYTQTIYNPIALLPESNVFAYMVGSSAKLRHSDSNADQVSFVEATQEESSYYVYLWVSNKNLEFTDVYPNRPLYYLLVVLGGVALGAVVYFIARYSYCKKRQNQL